MNHWPQLADDLMGQCQSTFGESITYQPKAGDAFSITAIFEAAHAVVEPGTDVPVETLKPVLFVRLSDFRDAGRADPKKGDTPTIRGTSYKVVEVQDDGHAEATLILMRQA